MKKIIVVDRTSTAVDSTSKAPASIDRFEALNHQPLKSSPSASEISAATVEVAAAVFAALLVIARSRSPFNFRICGDFLFSNS